MEKNLSKNLLLRWVSWVQRHALWVALSFIPLTAGAVWLCVDQLKLKTDYADLISDDLPFHARWVEYKKEFPNITDTTWIIIEGPDVASTQSVTAQFFKEIQTESQLFQRAYLLGDPAQSHQTRSFIEARPVLDYSDLLPGEASLLWLYEKMDAYEKLNPNFQISMTGTAALSYEEMKNVAQGVGWAGALSFLVTAILLWVGLGSFRITLFTMIGLVAGLIFTGAFAAVSVGHLNMISIAFAVLFIGLGLDYSLHLFLRYREFLVGGMPPDQALRQSVSQVGQSLWLCAITTCAGFYAFIPTDYRGVAELGIISGTGMFINFFIQISLLPALIHLFPHAPGALKAFRVTGLGPWLNQIILRHFVRIRWVAAGLTIAGVWAALQIQFDPNPLSLQDPTTEAFKTFESLMDDEGQAPWTAKVLANSEDEAKTLASQLSSLDLVHSVMWAGGFGAPIEYLPPELKERFISPSGKYRLEVFAKENLNDIESMRRFSDQVLRVAPQATDDPITIPLTADAVVDAFSQAGTLALVLTFLIIFWALRSWRDTSFAMTPLVLGGLITILMMRLTGQDFNFANIVVLPLLLGIAMDSGIHVVHQYRVSTDDNPIAGSTSRAMFFSALVNITSFGTLALAAHRGMSSMGILLSAGLSFMLLCTFVVLPALLVNRQTAQARLAKAA